MRVNRKGQITIPARLRRKFGLQTGDYVTFTEVDGEIVIIPRKSTEQPGQDQEAWHDGVGGEDGL
ncbi:AbrB/MazE/SpoVT family DNA-binding domain-containing protein [Streptosporangium sp. NBC_01639]|uniref:AbrB/MazE/SpoVT family DNA-binding domain-containing protein n=1 Tax=Streptosporangium sp. NBC_01639 TaxID=2975948 RepID=UPI003868503E|nr:AbrB/MazE/SpoVT family DNA-binding domain-containing protein [Streptosporangium sp. NBC_01639]